MHIMQSNPVDDASPALCAGRKVTATHKALLWQLLNDHPACPSRRVLHTIAGHRGRLLSPSVKSIACGRPGGAIAARATAPSEHPKKNLSRRGILSTLCPVWRLSAYLFAHGLDQPETFRPVVAQLIQAVEVHKHTHPDEALLCCSIASPRSCVACKRCFLRRCSASIASPPSIPMRILSQRSLAGGITAQRCVSFWGT